jgi:hypothetical protein
VYVQPRAISHSIMIDLLVPLATAQPLNLLKKMKPDVRAEFASPWFSYVSPLHAVAACACAQGLSLSICSIDQYMQTVVAMEGLSAAIKKNDRVFFYAGIGNALSPGPISLLMN